MSKINACLLVFLYICTVLTIILSKFASNFQNLLQTVSKESGFFEWISFFILFFMGFYGFFWIYKNHKINKYILIPIALFTLLCIIAAFEEISWGQHIFGYTSNNFFLTHNHQKETNLHNLIDANLFSSMIYSSVYTFFVFIPLFVRLTFLKKYVIFFPNLHTTLIILFGSSLQFYFYDNLGAFADTVSLLFGILLFSFVLSIKKLWNKMLIFHFIFVLFSTILFMICYDIFSFYNKQYEIREVFVVFGSFIYFVNITNFISKKYNISKS